MIFIIFRKITEKFNKDGIYYILLLLLFSILIHPIWFGLNTILTAGDWYYLYDEMIRQLFYSWGTWTDFNNFGNVNMQIPFNLFMSLWSFLTYIGVTFDQATKLTFFLPISILSFLSPYFLVKKLTKDNLASFVSAVFYGTTTYGIVNQLPIQFVYSLTPLILLLFIKVLENNTIKDWILLSLLYCIGICYEVRIMYIVTGILFFYFTLFYFCEIKKYWRNIFFTLFIIILLNLFWIFPVFLGGGNREIVLFANRGLFGNNLSDILHSFTISTWNWTGGALNNQFIKQPISLQFWVLPIMLFISLFFKRTFFHKKILFFWFLIIIGIMLTKQSGQPFTHLYKWLYENFPGFNLFREASKFYLIIAVAYTGLFGYIVAYLNKKFINKKIFFYPLISLLVVVFLWNSKPLINGDIKSIFVSRNISNEYLVLKDFVLKDKNFFRTFLIPRESRWAIVTNEHPKVSLISLIANEWKDLPKTNNKNSELIQDAIMGILKLPFANNLVDISSIKYIIVPLQDVKNEDDFFVYYGGDKNQNIRQWYINQLDNLRWLKRIDIGTKDLVVYENVDYRDHIYETKEQESIYKHLEVTKVDYKFINPTNYKIFLKNIKEKIYVNFSEKYHFDWNLKIGKFNWFNVLISKNYFLENRYHSKNDAGLNSFLIDPEYIKQNFDKSCYTENPNGSINMEITLYFKPQSYFYLGLVISIVALLSCLTYLGYYFIKRRKKKTLS